MSITSPIMVSIFFGIFDVYCLSLISTDISESVAKFSFVSVLILGSQEKCFMRKKWSFQFFCRKSYSISKTKAPFDILSLGGGANLIRSRLVFLDFVFRHTVRLCLVSVVKWHGQLVKRRKWNPKDVFIMWRKKIVCAN